MSAPASQTRAPWRDAAAYGHLLRSDRSAFAWEWLRRRGDYDLAWAAGKQDSSAFGLIRLENPEHNASDARPMWRADVDATVLIADASVRTGSDTFDSSKFGNLLSVAHDAIGEHVLLSDSARSIRIDIISGTILEGPVELAWRIAGLHAAITPLLSLRRLISLNGMGRFADALHPIERRAERWILTLRTWDALVAGATQREIAEEFFPRADIGPRWRSETPSLRLRAQRLVALARSTFNQGPRPWLTA